MLAIGNIPLFHVNVHFIVITHSDATSMGICYQVIMKQKIVQWPTWEIKSYNNYLSTQAKQEVNQSTNKVEFNHVIHSTTKLRK